MWMYYTWFQAGALEYRHLLYPVFRIRIRLDPDSNCQTGSGSVFEIRIRIRIGKKNPGSGSVKNEYGSETLQGT